MLRTPGWAVFWAVFRLAAAALGLAAVIAQLTRTIERADAATSDYAGHVPTVIWNFLSYFTIEANILAVVTLTIGGVWALGRGRSETVEPRWFAVLLACVTTYMVITGIVYNALLRGVALDQGVTVPWSNEVLHVVIPLVLMLDLLFAPKRRALPWRTVGIIILYPIVWIVYTLVRGPFITAPANGDAWWYPYPFLNPHNFDNGFGTVALYIVGIAVAVVATGLLVIWIGRRRAALRDDVGPGAVA